MVTGVFERIVCGVDGSEASRAGVRLAEALAEHEGGLELVSIDDDSPAEGHPADRLLGEVRRVGATLAVVGSHGHSRAVGIALGSVATMLVHEAPCSVLVAREVDESEHRTIVVGIDRSAESERARAVAHELGERFGADVVEIVEASDPVAELSEASEDAAFVVVGSRGLRGVRALGSVSERVAHDARCHVLVVRPYG